MTWIKATGDGPAILAGLHSQATHEAIMRPITLWLSLALLLGVPASSAFAQQHTHAAPAATTGTVPAQRYVTDATLRQQMREIHGEVLALAGHEHTGLTPELASRSADQITGHVNTIIVNCRLPPDADAALHVIIGQLLQDASLLKKDPGSLEAIPRMRHALEQYARQFDDPGFPDSPAG